MADILKDVQASGYPGYGGHPIIEEYTRNCKGKGVVLHIECSHSEEMTVVLNGKLISWQQRTSPKIEFDSNLTSELVDGTNLLVVSLVNYSYDIDLQGHIDIGSDRIDLKLDHKPLRRTGLVYQAAITLINE